MGVSGELDLIHQNDFLKTSLRSHQTSPCCPEGMVLFCAVLFCTVFYLVVLYCVLLYCMVDCEYVLTMCSCLMYNLFFSLDNSSLSSALKGKYVFLMSLPLGKGLKNQKVGF